MTSPSPIILIAGPTASGKSAHALGLAAERNGVIINADALQIYNVLPILTAQPDAASLAAAPHALYGILPPEKTTSVADWCARAVEAIRNAWTHGQTPIVVGGTGLYLKSLQYGLSPLPNVPDVVRSAARALQAELGNPAFHATLANIDPKMAARLNPNDSQRLIRAYEVMVATGKSLQDWQDAPPVPPLPDALFDRILVDGDRDVLRMRSLKRLRQMIDMGVLDEVRGFAAQIVAQNLHPDCAPTNALGYHAFTQHLAGKISIEDAVHAAAIQTGQYIKRQQTWLRHQMTFDHTITVT